MGALLMRRGRHRRRLMRRCSAIAGACVEMGLPKCLHLSLKRKMVCGSEMFFGVV